MGGKYNNDVVFADCNFGKLTPVGRSPFWGVYDLPMSRVPTVLADKLKELRKQGLTLEEISALLDTL